MNDLYIHLFRNKTFRRASCIHFTKEASNLVNNHFKQKQSQVVFFLIFIICLFVCVCVGYSFHVDKRKRSFSLSKQSPSQLHNHGK
jgi:hypothetical protein